MLHRCMFLQKRSDGSAIRIVECPECFELVSMREAEVQGGKDGATEERIRLTRDCHRSPWSPAPNKLNPTTFVRHLKHQMRGEVWTLPVNRLSRVSISTSF